MGSTTSARGGGAGLSTLLLVLFVALKLTHHIDWSWWWVCAPLWIPAGVALVALMLFVGIALIGEWRSERGRRLQRMRARRQP